jgi:hypothetical protein
MKLLFSIIITLYLFPVLGQSDLWGKYKLAEPNGTNYEGFALYADGEAVFLKVFSQKFLFHNELPSDSLSLIFNPGIKDVSTFPVSLQLVQPIKAKWALIKDSLFLYEEDLKVRFRKYKTSYVVAESQIAGFINAETPMYFKFIGFDENGIQNSKLNVMTSNKDQIPSNYDLFEYFTEIPEVILIKTTDSTLIDSLNFPHGKGEKIIFIDSKVSRGKDNVFSNFQLNKKSQVGYFYNEKHGYEYSFYNPSEIDQIITGKKFLLKREAWYEQGVNHGKWLYYDKKGSLTKTEIWKKGKLVKTIENKD